MPSTRKTGGLRTAGIQKTDRPGQPLVTVVTVVYNGEKYVRHTIESVLGQTYPNLEYIVVDGGSTDATLSILGEYESRIDYWVSERDRGISDAFNKGIGLAGGSIVGLINADDWYEPATVERVVQHLQNADVAYGNLQSWERGAPQYVFHADHTRLAWEMTVNHPTVFVRKALYEQFGVFDLSYKIAMDYDLMMRFYTGGARFVYVNQVLANMRLEGVSEKQWITGFREVRQIKEKYLGKKSGHALYFYKQVAATYLSRRLGTSPLAGLLRFYRRHLSMIRKSK
ncbi:MAG: glycosyltransferase [Cytophagales bacterium]|nr:glycosyltransferase [Cytophagales bacterium]